MRRTNSDVVELSIRSAIMKALHSSGSSSSSQDALSDLDFNMAKIETRDLCYSYAMAIAEEDHQRRDRIAELLLTYCPGFPPCLATLQRIADLCMKYAALSPTTASAPTTSSSSGVHPLPATGAPSSSSSTAATATVLGNTIGNNATVNSGSTSCSSGCPFIALLQSVNSILLQYKVQPESSSTAAHARHSRPVDFRQADNSNTVRNILPQYLQSQPFQPVAHDDGRGKRTINIGAPNVRECEMTIVEKNGSGDENFGVGSSGGASLRYELVRCRDYMDQTPLAIGEAGLQTHLRVLRTYFDSYTTHTSIQRASAVLLKVICDGYVSKIPLLNDFKFLRQVSVAFLPVFLGMLGSEYQCVKLYVFDLLITLASRCQLIDTSSTHVGLRRVLEEEMCWLMAAVVQRLAFQDEADRVWDVALKATLAVVPRRLLWRMDFRAFRKFLSLPGMAHCHPQIYGMLVENLCHKVYGAKIMLPTHDSLRGCPECAATTSSASSSSSPGVSNSKKALIDLNVLRVNEELLSTVFTPSGLVFLYRQSVTTSAKLHSFFILLALSVCSIARKNMSMGRGALLLEGTHRVLSLMTDLGLYWHLHCLTFYFPHSLVKDLPQSVLVDIDSKETREIKPLFGAVLNQVLSWFVAYHRLPDAMAKAIGNNPDDAVLSDCLVMIPQMLKDAATTSDADITLRRVACSLSFNLLRVLKVCRKKEMSDAVIDAIAHSPTQKIRSASVDILGSLTYLLRSQPEQSIGAFHRFLHTLTSGESSHATLMDVYGVLMGAFTQQNTTEFSDGDVSSHLITGQLQLLQGSADLIGSSILWALYWGLRHGVDAAILRARYVLVSVLSSMSLPGPSTNQIALWTKVMSDPHAATAIIGAQKIIRISGLAHHGIYEAAISEAQRTQNPTKLSNSYSMASSIWSRVQAEQRRKVAADEV